MEPGQALERPQVVGVPQLPGRFFADGNRPERALQTLGLSFLLRRRAWGCGQVFGEHWAVDGT